MLRFSQYRIDIREIGSSGKYGWRRPFKSGSADGRYKFSSKELDTESGLYYFGARYYDSWSGRWMSVDPLSKKYPGWSPYNYVEDDPTGMTDPTGKGGWAFSVPIWGMGTPTGKIWVVPPFNEGAGKVPISLAGSKEFNPASISANGFAGLSSSKGMTGIVKALGSLGESYDYVTTGVGLLGKVLSSQGLRDFSSEMGNYAFAANLFAALPTLSKVATGKRSLTAGTAYDVVTPFVATEIGSAIGTDGTSLLVGLGFQEAKGAYDFLKYTVTPKLVQI